MTLHHAHWPKNMPHQIPQSATSVWHNLAVSAQRFPHKPALVFFGTQTSYAQLAEQVERLAAFLHSLGVQQGDRVIVLMQNCPQLVAAHYAVLRANAVVVPVNPMNLAQELQHYIADSGARVALVTGDLAPQLAQASDALEEQQRLQHLIVTQFTDAFEANVQGDDAPPPAWRDWLCTHYPAPSAQGVQVHRYLDALACEAAPPAHRATAEDLAVLPYTSGTTGLPKGCMHLHRSINYNIMAAALWGRQSMASVTLSVVPMFHITGMVVVMHGGIYLGATQILMPRWDRELAGRLISKWHVNSWTNIPTMVIDLMASPNFAQFDLSSLQHIGGGGAAMPQAVAQRLYDQFGLRYIEGYGLTETAAPSHSNPMENPKLQCLGIPFIGVQARVVDPDTLQTLPSGEQGEILVSGPQVFEGYWQQPEATQQAFVTLDGQRFFRTGDLGHVDEEGYFYLTDRLKRMINASGFKVWPAEVESLMYRHPAIQEACIIAARDDYRGETVKAVVVLRPDHAQTSAEDILAWCRDNMAVYKVPRLIEFVPALPKSGSGKVMWRVLQEQELSQASQASQLA
ncbi:long-chain fatty acid--CoA ligase [Vandammella animalimorsus]|uniref:Long-chain fatty acid--CoA ligase n=1 Tax=Vandammella animalimorsus TaxID=2029117 RepID=A0A2A2T8I3_9BURK|nr:long-chain fatty acid--CoA ligase [Vandammella animalimorsus]PAT33468.1 long-chain fatty acid--CoA ligase [Vandammella animalimorsus]PAX18509.1 long-chain fatty acid--CoA ligase [Vandammella animalimorsus]PAX20672.1 long-chain fatty acid--CoA ligase [Vandammella animalimorsus]